MNIPLSIKDPLHNLHRILWLYPFANSHISPSSFPVLQQLDARELARSPLPMSLNSYICFVPSRLGRNKALDDTADCLLDLYLEFLSPIKPFGSGCKDRKYLKAVHSLRECLGDPDRSPQPETICATLLLGLIEVFRGSKNMLTHVHGASELIRARDSTCHHPPDGPFERAMLLAAQGPLSTESVTKASIHTLDSQSWRSRIETVPKDSILDEDRPCHKLKFFQGSSLSLPQIVQECLDILIHHRSDRLRIESLLDNARRFRQNFLDWAFTICEEHGLFSSASTLLQSNELYTRLLASSLLPTNTQSYLTSSPLTPLLPLTRALAHSITTCSSPLDIGSFTNIAGWLIITNRIIQAMSMFMSRSPYNRTAEKSPTDPSSSSSSSSSSRQHVQAAYPSNVQLIEQETLHLSTIALATQTYLRDHRTLGLLYSRFSVSVARAARVTSKDWSRDDHDHDHDHIDGEAERLSMENEFWELSMEDDFGVLEKTERFLGLVREYSEAVGNVK